MQKKRQGFLDPPGLVEFSRAPPFTKTRFGREIACSRQCLETNGSSATGSMNDPTADWLPGPRKSLIREGKTMSWRKRVHNGFSSVICARKRRDVIDMPPKTPNSPRDPLFYSGE